MGYFLREHDVYIGSLLSELNVRFAPVQRKKGEAALPSGGIKEMAALQKEFKLFKKGRSFVTSVGALNVAAFNHDTRERWHKYLEFVGRCDSNVGSQTGDEAIVGALIKNLGSADPLPVHFTSHDMREDKRVLITPKARPVFYLESDFLTISLPMQPQSAGLRDARKKAEAKKKSGKKK